MKITWTKRFAADLKFYQRKKKYFKIKDDLKTVTAELEKGNLVGDRLENFGTDENSAAYKVRIANSSANFGKSNGFRLIYYVVIEETIYLLTIYSKKDDERIPSDTEISELIKNIFEE